MATILDWWSPFLFCQIRLPVYWWVCILSQTSNPCYIEIEDWCLHTLHHIFQDSHLSRIFECVCLFFEWIGLAVTSPTGIPASSSKVAIGIAPEENECFRGIYVGVYPSSPSRQCFLKRPLSRAIGCRYGCLPDNNPFPWKFSRESTNAQCWK